MAFLFAATDLHPPFPDVRWVLTAGLQFAIRRKVHKHASCDFGAVRIAYMLSSTRETRARVRKTKTEAGGEWRSRRSNKLACVEEGYQAPRGQQDVMRTNGSEFGCYGLLL